VSRHLTFAICLLPFAMLFVAAQSPAATPWSGLLYPTYGTGACATASTTAPGQCAIDWSTAGIPGGIPSASWTQSGSTILASTYGNGSTDATSGIQSALNSCGGTSSAGKYVLLSAGTFLLDGQLTIPSYCALRGQGANQTVLNSMGTSNEPIYMGSGGPTCGTWTTYCPYPAQVSITGGYAAGSTSITVSNASGISAGMYLVIDQIADGTFVTTSGGEGARGSFTDGNQSATGVYAQGQISEVENVNGTTLTISPPLYVTYSNGPVAIPFSATKYAGVENLQIYANNSHTNSATNDSYSNIDLYGCAYCWVSGVEGNYTDGDHVRLYWNFHSEIVNSYFSNAYHHAAGNYDSDISLGEKTTLSLVQNNILERLHCSTMLETGVSGNVIAYNYTFGDFDTTAPTYVMIEPSMHASHPQFNLYEGNVGSSHNPDSIWGSNANNTAFRNWMSGTTKICSPSTARITVTCSPFGAYGGSGVNGWWATAGSADLSITYLGNDWNIIGNVFGSTTQTNLETNVPQAWAVCGVGTPCGSNSRTNGNTYGYTWGYTTIGDNGGGTGDTLQVYTDAFLHGNFLNINGSLTWASGLTQSLPASFYLSGQPSWWPGSLKWPAIGPDISGGAGPGGHAYSPGNAAQYCYQSIMGGTDGTGSPLTFNAASCYGSSGGSSTPPTISTFTATPASITSGQSSSLSWQVANATDVVIDNSVGDVTSTSFTVVRPMVTTTYILTAYGLGGAMSQTAMVTVTAAQAPTYWVSPTGAAAWGSCSGTTPLSGASACSLATANSSAVAGDLVYLRSGTYTQSSSGTGITPSNSGTSSSNMITFEGYPGDSSQPIISGGYYGIDLDGGNTYISVLNIEFLNQTIEWALITEGANHNQVANCNFEVNIVERAPTFFIGPEADLKFPTHNWVHNNQFIYTGSADGTEGQGCTDGGGDDLDIGQSGGTYGNTTGDMSNNNTIENNVFDHDPHAAIDGYGEYTVIRNNVFHNEPWSSGCTTTSNYSNTTYSNSAYDGLYGHRDSQYSEDFGRDMTFNLLEGNRYGYASINQDNDGAEDFDLATNGSIFRYNYLYASMGSCLQFKYQRGSGVGVGGNGGTYDRTYNNTFYDCGIGWPPATEAGGDGCNTTSCPFASVAISNYDGAGSAAGNVLKNNLIYEPDSLGLAMFGADAIDHSPGGSTPPFSPTISWSEFPTAVNNWCTKSQSSSGACVATGNPLFNNPDISNPASLTLPDLSLQSTSGAIDKGTNLTVATNSGSNTTTLTVADAQYFQDGTWGSDLSRPSAGLGGTMQADWIAIGSTTNVVQISAIAYGTYNNPAGTIKLATPMTWNTGANVWLYKKSDGTQVLYGAAPDMGAYEYTGQGVTTTTTTTTTTSSTTSTTTTTSSSTTTTQPVSGGNNIYIAQSAAGAQNGSDCADAYAYTFFNNPANWTTGTPSSTLIGPGTMVHLCGTFTGTAGAAEFTFQGSGTSGNPITILFEKDASLTAPYWGDGSHGAITCSGYSYVTVDGGTNGSILNTANGTAQANQQSSNGIYLDSCPNAEIKNLSITGIYMNQGTSSGATDTGGQNTFGVSLLGNSTNSLIHNNTLNNARAGVNVTFDDGFDASGVQIFNNTIADHPWGVVVGADNAQSTAKGVQIYGNAFSNWTNWQYPSSTYHTDGIIVFNDNTSGVIDTYSIFNNSFTGSLGNGSATGFIACGEMSACTIFNNLMVDTGPYQCNGYFWLYNPNGADAIYNNTLIGSSGNANSAVTMDGGMASLTVKNNIFLNVGFGFSDYRSTLADLLADITASNNNIWLTSSAGAPGMGYNAGGSGSYISFAAWQSDGYDASSSNSNPNLTTSYMLPPGSSAIGLGANLTSLNIPVLDSDKAGIARPISGAWDAGAYKYTGGGGTTTTTTTTTTTSTTITTTTTSTITTTQPGGTTTTTTTRSTTSTTTLSGLLPVPDLSGLNGKTYTLTDEINFSYPVSGVTFGWSFQPIGIGASGLRSIGDGSPSPALPISGAPTQTSAPRFTPASAGLTPGSYQLTVTVTQGDQSQSATATITLVSADFSAIQVYPNPWRSDKHAGKPITFANLPVNSTVKIFTTSGHKVKELSAHSSGLSTWDLTNDSGDKVASGIYIYLITDSQGDKTKGKVAIIK